MDTAAQLLETDAYRDGRKIAAMQKLASGRTVTGDAIERELAAAGQTTPAPHGSFRFNTGRPFTKAHPLLRAAAPAKKAVPPPPPGAGAGT